MKNRNSLFVLVLFLSLVFSLSMVNAEVDDIIIWDGHNFTVTYAIADHTYLICGVESIELVKEYSDNLAVSEEVGGCWTWTPSITAGDRTFTIDGYTFTFPVFSQVDEFLSQVEGFTIFIGQDESYVEIQNFDLTGTNLQYINLYYEGEDFTIDWQNYDLVNLLSGLNADFNFKEGESYPVVNSLNINSANAITLVNNLLNSEHLGFTVDELNDDPQTYINQLLDYYNLAYEYPTSSRIIKNGDYYKVWGAEGYSQVQEYDLENKIKEIIDTNMVYINPFTISDELFKLTDEKLSDYFDLEAIDFNVTVDYSNLELRDGEYIVTIDYEDGYENHGTKDITIILDISNQEEQVVGSDGIFIPQNLEILEHIQRISGLLGGVTLTAVVHGSELPSNFVQPSSNLVENVVNYFEIDLNENVVGNYKVDFSVLNTFNKNKIKAYVYENGSWNKLPTYFIEESGGKYYFYFEVTHFSKFMIAEKKEVTITPGGGGGSRDKDDDECNEDWTCGEWTGCSSTSLQTRTCKDLGNCGTFNDRPTLKRSCTYTSPIVELGGEKPEEGGFARITGAVIGSIRESPSLWAFGFLVVVLVIGLIVIVSRKNNPTPSSTSPRTPQ